MNIGIDFDNTVVRYDSLFREVALKEKFLRGNWDGGTKTEIRNFLHRQPEGKKTWMKLQGLVYGKFMHGAEMMPGVANFLLSCNDRNHRVYIVSHKTEYGHFDLEKISLREEAIKWMKMRRFFDPAYIGIKQEDVFFADTREEKVNVIDRLNCDWFIDDLPEVFDEKYFPALTNKILFGTPDPNQNQDRMVLNSWQRIYEKIIGQITDQDIVYWVKGVVNHSLEHVEKIPGRGNSLVYRIYVSGGKSYALKHYPDQLLDNRPRLETEFKALEILHEYGMQNIPQPIKRNDDLNLGLYEWVDGKNVTNPTSGNLDQAINFSKKLFDLSKEMDGKSIGMASEACLSYHELVHQIEKRFLRLLEADMDSQNLSLFLNDVFTPLWNQVKNENISLWPEESRNKNLSREKQTLSPSDFGFHNCLKGNDGSLTFIDFDYFGWDDPVKLTADFIWHPAMNLNTEIKEKWQEAMLVLFSHDKQFESRLSAAMPIYGLRWAMIVLNEFIPDFAKRRKEAGMVENYNLEKSQKIQLKKAKHYCRNVKAMVSEVTSA